MICVCVSVCWQAHDEVLPDVFLGAAASNLELPKINNLYLKVRGNASILKSHFGS